MKKIFIYTNNDFLNKEVDNLSEHDNIKTISAKGTVKYIKLEGGFYGIIAEDGTKYNPTNLSPEYQKDGLKVSFEAKLKSGLMTIQMWGKNIEIISIKRANSNNSLDIHIVIIGILVAAIGGILGFLGGVIAGQYDGLIGGLISVIGGLSAAIGGFIAAKSSC